MNNPKWLTPLTNMKIDSTFNNGKSVRMEVDIVIRETPTIEILQTSPGSYIVTDNNGYSIGTVDFVEEQEWWSYTYGASYTSGFNTMEEALNKLIEYYVVSDYYL